ncbi:hypothetical protein GCM10010971_41320 [Silvimonas amylolytica]|uniref:Uncharacterized protein n=2 Tax=Silvimonas amylolytica TaxID=449663 RepID=A0ABQ2PSV0_9NEIS|nr:hypothetical protein GCM10010971_41320 [Silvimonas amylolytica]
MRELEAIDAPWAKGLLALLQQIRIDPRIAKDIRFDTEAERMRREDQQQEDEATIRQGPNRNPNGSIIKDSQAQKYYAAIKRRNKRLAE